MVKAALIAAVLGQAAVSSPLGEGVCVQLVAAFDPSTQVGQSVTGIGAYCSLSGCTLSGRFTVGTATVGVELNTNGFAYSANGWFKEPRTANLEGMRFESGNIVWYLSGAAAATLSGATARLDVSNGITSSLGFVQAATYLRSVGVAFASLPTCNAGAVGSLEYITDLTCMGACDGTSWRCLTPSDGGYAVTSATIVSIGQAHSPTGAVDSTTNGHILGQAQSATVRYLTGGISAAGTGAGRTIQFECTGAPSGKRCLADISCTNTTHGFDGGVLFTVPFFGYGGASNCQFSGDIVRCLGRNTPVDGGTDCTADPVFLINNLSIEGTYP